MQETHHKWYWHYRQKLIWLVVVLVIAVAGTWYLADCPCHADAYNEYVFQPYQALRIAVLKYIPFSIGDIVYVSWGFSLLLLVIRWVYYIAKLQTYASTLRYAVIKAASALVWLYVLFMVGWGGNYYKEPLARYWQLEEKNWGDTSIAAFDRYLVLQLNATAPRYKANSFKETVRKAKSYYQTYTDCYKNGKGLQVKPSLFGNWMQYMGVQGYYNPFTGEGQVNRGELHFMQPYIICHEMAHQTGVGAEDDANLLAYALAVSSQDTSFMYAAYLNLWLYTHPQLRMRDSVAANAIKAQLNRTTIAHLKELKAQRKKYHSKLSSYTGDVYDQYLKLNGQQDGIESYDKVTVSAWLWEQQRNYKLRKLYIP
ncbi:hypothetical protein CAP35_00025 [Chitinophagaceae bacterium IBVUCB1]|nr:hypothetical protein CAP35_00025 [Chitinophagaceae bacterium IBVUCB1]